MTTRRFGLLLCVAAATALPACDPAGPSVAGPALDSIRPRAALVGDGEITVNLWGEEFTESSTIRWGDIELETTYSGPQSLVASVPASLFGTADSVPVTVADASTRDTLWFLVVAPLAPTEHRLIAGGLGYTCGISDDGQTVCWGAAAARVAPDLSTEPPAVRPIADDPGFVHLTAGGFHACGLTPDGTAYCWGEWSPALGREHVHPAHIPMPVDTDLRFAYLEAADAYTCGVTTDGEAYCWGEEDAGQLGDGRGGRPPPSSTTPIRVPLDVTVVSVSVGDFSACAVGTNARVYCWGAANYLGRSEPATGSAPPGPVTSDELYLDVAVADGITCAVTVHRDVDCWTSDLPERYASGPFTSIRDGGYDFCATAPDGTGWCWGDAPASTLGTADPGWTPSPLLGGLRFRQLAMGTNHYCGIAEDDRAYCWGRIGSGTGITWYVPDPTAVETTERFTAVDAGTAATCGLATDDRMLCWGDVVYVRGDNVVEGTLPIDAAPGLTFRALSVEGRTCGIRTDGTLSCWGLGTASDFDRSGDWADVAQGTHHGCAVDSDGAAYCWGSNTDGQLGDGTMDARAEPVAVVGGYRFREISVGLHHTCALTVDDQVFCWGWGGGGSLGVGDTNDRLQPTPVVGGQTYETVRSSEWYSCARTTAGELYCWGSPHPADFDAELTDCYDYGSQGAAVECYTSPARMRMDVALVDIRIGWKVACGLDAGGQVHCWGRSLNTEISSPPVAPEPLNDASSFSDIAVGLQHICGLKDDGAAFCWGYNDQGVLLGIADAPAYPAVPTAVPTSVTF